MNSMAAPKTAETMMATANALKISFQLVILILKDSSMTAMLKVKYIVK
jgi:hypothetical protein